MAASDFKIEPVDSDQAPDSLVQQGTAVSDRVSEADDVPDRDNDQLQLFSAVLSKRRDEWVRARAAEGTDTRWAEDLDQFNGTDTPNLMAANMMVSVEQGFPVTTQNSKPSRSTVFVQVTRQKTNAAVARLGDILLPTEDRNFSIEPTPTPKMPGWVNTQMPPVHVPPLAEPGAGGNPQGGPAPTGMGSMPNTPMGAAAPQAPQAGAPGAPMQPAPDDPVKQLQDKIAAEEAEAKRRSDLMQQKIEDALDQSDWNAECRRMIHDAGVFGTGVLKGPVVMSRVKKAWRRTTDIHGKPIWSLDVQQILAPASFRVDPRNVYPDPACGERIQDGRGIFELQRLTRKQVRDLAKQPGYIRSQLQAVLREGPQTPTDMTPLRDPLRAQRDLVANEVFEHWTTTATWTCAPRARASRWSTRPWCGAI
jgi:hypothetical protein